MLRHLRMGSSTKKLPRLEGKLYNMIQEWCRPLYRYRIPHTPSPRGRVCTCAYPLYTLRSSRRSPYDEPTVYTSAPESTDATSLGALSIGDGSTSSSRSSGCPSPLYTPSVATVAHSAAASSFLFSFRGLPSLRARWAVRSKGARHAAASPPTPAAPSTHPSNACYRCEICDGLQGHSKGSDCTPILLCSAAGGDVSKASGHARATVTISSAGWCEENEVEETTDVTAASFEAGADERYGYTISTDIANTAMEDADVAELRRMDPFHVEVVGGPSWSALAKQIVRELQAQLTRCGLRKRDLSQYAAAAALNSELGRETYKSWVRQESSRKRERQLHLATFSSTPGLAFSVSPLTAASADQVIIKGKLETLETAAYLARYAIAAYGLPFELNYFSSLCELAKLMAEPHRRYVCASSEEQLESMRRMLQGEEPDALLECVASRYSLRVGQSCWALFLDHAANRVVLTFRGSLTPADVVVDITEGYANVVLERVAEDGAPTTASADAPQRICTAIPLGFYESVLEAGAQLLPVLCSIHQQYSNYQLCVTGHSLGGIQASVFHLFFCGPWRATLHSSTTLLRRAKALRCPSSLTSAPSSVAAAAPTTGARVCGTRTAAQVPFRTTVTCTFGAAPVVERRVVAPLNVWLRQEEQRSGSRLLAFSNGMDLVSRLQVRSLQNAFLQRYSQPAEESLYVADEAVVDHDGTAVAAVSEKSVPLLAIPGSFYNMTSGTRRRHLLAVPVSATAVREQVILVPEAAWHHYPSLYLRSLNELLRMYKAKCRFICEASATAPPPPAKATAVTPPIEHFLHQSGCQ